MTHFTCVACNYVGPVVVNPSTTVTFCGRCGGILFGVQVDFEYEDKTTSKSLRQPKLKVIRTNLWDEMQLTLLMQVKTMISTLGISVGLLDVTKDLWMQWSTKMASLQLELDTLYAQKSTSHNNNNNNNNNNDNNNNNNTDNGDDSDTTIKKQHIIINPISTICIIYLGCHKIHEPVFLSDFLKWILDGTLTLNFSKARYMEKSFLTRKKLSKILQKVMSALSYPVPNTIPPFFGVRLLNEFSLPASLLSPFIKISERFPIIPRSGFDIEVWACAALVFLLKLIYGLDDKFRKMEDYTEINLLPHLPTLDDILSTKTLPSQDEARKRELMNYLNFCKREYYTFSALNSDCKSRYSTLNTCFDELRRPSSFTPPVFEDFPSFSWSKFPLTKPTPLSPSESYSRNTPMNSATYESILKKIERLFHLPSNFVHNCVDVAFERRVVFK